jgi:Mrp family chromosome partitioning ATPase
MSDCTHDCSTCGESCADRKNESPFQIKPLREGCRVGKVYGVVSGKGGVGKSMVTSQLAVSVRREGYNVAVLDADITGPSIPKAFGIHGRAVAHGDAIVPVTTATGIQLMSVNLLLEHETDPVIWRGPVIGGVVQQFWGDTLWNDVDYMFVDMPPGTGDVALNVFQTLPVDGVIIVASPQDLVSMVVQKAVKMAQMMHIPIVGLVENMSYVQCPDCGKKLYIFGEGKTEEAARPAPAGQDAHRPAAGQADGRRLHRAVRRPLAGRRGGRHPQEVKNIPRHKVPRDIFYFFFLPRYASLMDSSASSSAPVPDLVMHPVSST